MPHVTEIGHAAAARAIETIRVALDAAGEGAAVAVVDPHGELVAFLRTDGCRLPSITIAINKAYTAAREHVDSQVIGERSAAEGFPMSNFGDPRITAWGGGIPILAGGKVVGAVGVSGLPEERDVELAKLGAAAVNS